METKKEKKKSSWKMILLLQVVVFIYSMISSLSKSVSSLISNWGLFSWQALGGIFVVFLALGVYAFFWQRILKKVELSVAYANKAVGLLWTLVWAALLFGEKITPGNVVGLVVICAGVLVVTKDE
ncbi:MAG: EamA family transporter [Clostridiales bacterium]|nr:EamA family transporter [Clostridiales bacterium]